MRIDLKLMSAVAAVWFIWGSTFAGMRYAVATMPPFVMAGCRFAIAGVVLYLICLARGRGRVAAGEWKHAVVSGATLILLGNGVTAYTVQYLPTGINALLLSTSAIWMTIVAFLWGGERPGVPAIAGMVVGLIGLAILVQSHAGGAIPLWAATIAVLASISWSFGSIYGRRVGRPADVMRATALQMIAGGGLLVLAAALSGEWTAFDVRAISPSSLAGFAWLVVFGSIIAYSAYQFTMHVAPPALASTYAYVNPVVSVGLGYVLFGERLSSQQILASAVILAGVALMMWPTRAGTSRRSAIGVPDEVPATT